MRTRGRLGDDGVDRGDLLMEPNGDGAVPPRVRELVAAVGRKHELHTEPFGRLAEHPRLIPGRRREQKNSSHVSCQLPAASPNALR